MIRFKSQTQDILQKSIIQDGFEKLHSVPVNHRSDRSLRKERKVSIRINY